MLNYGFIRTSQTLYSISYWRIAPHQSHEVTVFIAVSSLELGHYSSRVAKRAEVAVDLDFSFFVSGFITRDGTISRVKQLV